MENELVQNNAITKAFKKFFDNKGNVGSIAEKARRNLELKRKSPINVEGRTHYFAVGHAFKNIDYKEVFSYELDEQEMQKKPTRFLSLQKDAFNLKFCKLLADVVEHIRDINSHYVHTFDVIELANIAAENENKENPEDIVNFLKESFELAAINSYINYSNSSYKDYYQNSKSSENLVDFLAFRFYPPAKGDNDYLKEERNAFLAFKNRADKAIEYLLFINVPEDFDWRLSNSSMASIFTIKKGRYLSFYACLFLLSIFLYKGEAEKLISKIKGFKRNDASEFKSKRDIFTLFSKKFTSQDVDSEEQQLVKFRDLVQYLNHYPVIWNKELELNPKLKADNNCYCLQNKILEMEIERLFYKDFETDEFEGIFSKQRFLLYAKYQLFEQLYPKALQKECIRASFTEEERSQFTDMINQSSELKGKKQMLKDLCAKKNVPSNKQDKWVFQIKELEREIEIDVLKGEPNLDLEKSKEQIDKGLFFMSYGRNQDRFMQFAARFLAENNYFGKDACFKTYQFYTTEEQNDFLEEKRNRLNQLDKTHKKEEYDNLKKEIDHLKYHQGKLVHNSTYQYYLDKYPEWDTPFVVENNAVQLILHLTTKKKDDEGKDEEKKIIIQRNLMVYLLEDALYKNDQSTIESAGQSLLNSYYAVYCTDFENYKSVLKNSSSLSIEQKGEFGKLFPKRLLHHYLPANKNNEPKYTALQLILEETKVQEERYENLLGDAKRHNIEEDFIKKNKGKQFKLRFLRKAWHLMYFKDVYLKKAEKEGHHKRFHITKEEFNDFSRWMYAFDESISYKEHLNDLFKEKGFLGNPDFKKLFETARSFDNLYKKTKENYKEWLEQNCKTVTEHKYELANYDEVVGGKLFCINISHFIKYLETCGKLNKKGLVIQHEALENVGYLIPEYYYKDKLNPKEYKKEGKLYNKLRTVKLEDALLYEMAMRYLKKDKEIISTAKINVHNILSNDLTLGIKDIENHPLYKLIIPFNKIDSFTELMAFKKEQEDEFKSSFLGNLADYLPKVKSVKETAKIYINFKDSRELKYEELNAINSHLISNSLNFTKIEMELERFYIMAGSLKIEKENRITFEEVGGLKTYKSIDKWTRNKAFHFGVPKDSYGNILLKIEKEFIQKEIKPKNAASWDALEAEEQKMCRMFLEICHNNFLQRKGDSQRKGDKQLVYIDAQNKYFVEVIKRS